MTIQTLARPDLSQAIESLCPPPGQRQDDWRSSSRAEAEATRSWRTLETAGVPRVTRPGDAHLGAARSRLATRYGLGCHLRCPKVLTAPVGQLTGFGIGGSLAATLKIQEARPKGARPCNTDLRGQP
jgi:hypothetical protein